jgi:hypothetical protein
MRATYFIRAVIWFFSIVGFIALALVIVFIVQIASNKYAATKIRVPEIAAPKSILEAGGYPSTPETVLAEYLRLDSEGANFSKKGTEYLQKLNPIESFYSLRLNYIGVIAGYRISTFQHVNNESTAIVEYDMVGTLEHLTKFQPRRKKEQHRVTLRKHEGKWRLDSELWPRISIETTLTYLRQSHQGRDSDRYQKLVNEIGSAARLEPFHVTQADLDNIKTVVSRYIKLEIQGRVVNSAQDWKNYVTKTFHRKPPAAGAYVVSGAYRIDEVDVYRDEASATVLYNVTKHYFDSKFKEANFQREYGQTLYLVRTADGWKIDRSSQELPFVYEHVVASNVTNTSK